MLCRLRPKKQTGSAQPLAFSRPRIVGALLPFRARLRRRALRRSGCGGHPPRQRPRPRPFPCPGSATTDRRRRAPMDCWDVSRRSRDLLPAGLQMAIQHVHGKAVVQVEAAGPGRRGLQEQGSSERDGPGMGMGIEEGRARDRFRLPNRMRFVSSNIPRRSRPTSSGLPIDPYPRPSGSLYRTTLRNDTLPATVAATTGSADAARRPRIHRPEETPRVVAASKTFRDRRGGKRPDGVRRAGSPCPPRPGDVRPKDVSSWPDRRYIFSRSNAAAGAITGRK